MVSQPLHNHPSFLSVLGSYFISSQSGLEMQQNLYDSSISLGHNFWVLWIMDYKSSVGWIYERTRPCLGDISWIRSRRVHDYWSLLACVFFVYYTYSSIRNYSHIL
jgi:hypothetical protein